MFWTYRCLLQRSHPQGPQGPHLQILISCGAKVAAGEFVNTFTFGNKETQGFMKANQKNSTKNFSNSPMHPFLGSMFYHVVPYQRLKKVMLPTSHISRLDLPTYDVFASILVLSELVNFVAFNRSGPEGLSFPTSLRHNAGITQSWV